MRTISILSLVLLLVLSAAAIAEVPHTSNTTKPAEGVVSYDLETLWTAGGDDDDDNIFGVIMQVLVDDDGLVYLLDQQLSEVAVFSPDGERVATLSREGDGPGEIRSPNDMFFFEDGRLGLVQIFPGRIVTIDREGNPATEYSYQAGDPSTGSGFAVLIQGQARGGSLVLAGITQGFANGTLDQTYFLANFGDDGAETSRFVEKKAQQSFAAMVLDEAVVDFPWARFDVTGDGHVVVAPSRDDYTVEIYAADGTLERTFSRPLEPWQRTEDDTNRMQMVMEAQGRNYPVMPEIVIMDTEPALNRLQTLADGSIWAVVNRDLREAGEGVLITYDVFSPSGEYLQKIELMGEGNGLNDLVQIIDNDHALVVRGFWSSVAASMGASLDEEEEPAPMSVEFCRISR
jgi:hypothetical protein